MPWVQSLRQFVADLLHVFWWSIISTRKFTTIPTGRQPRLIRHIPLNWLRQHSTSPPLVIARNPKHCALIPLSSIRYNGARNGCIGAIKGASTNAKTGPKNVQLSNLSTFVVYPKIAPAVVEKSLAKNRKTVYTFTHTTQWAPHF